MTKNFRLHLCFPEENKGVLRILAYIKDNPSTYQKNQLINLKETNASVEYILFYSTFSPLLRVEEEQCVQL